MRLASFIAVLAVSGTAAAQSTDVIRGRVTVDTMGVQGANVRATSVQGGVSKSAVTDRNGRYTIVFLNGEGDYWLDFTKLGLAPRRFEIKKIGDEEVMIADARMSSAIATLDTMNVTGQTNRMLPNRNGNADVGGGERTLTNNGLPPDQAGNLAAMAATLSGVQVIPGLDGAADMYSLLGLSGDQNNVTFNGLGSGINTLPPDVLASTSIRPFTFDPAIGGFSGAQISIQTIPGSNFSRRIMSNVDITPPGEFADETAQSQGQEYTNLRVGGNAAGPLAMDVAFYNGAYNFGRRFSDLRTLTNASALALSAGGVAPDSVSRLLAILRNQHVPTSPDNAPTEQSLNVGQALLNVDWMPSASGAGHSFTFGMAGSFRRAAPVSRGSLLLATPSHGGQSNFWNGNASVVHSNYFWFGVLSKTAVGVATSSSETQPYENIPEGVVRVTSTLPDGSSSIKSLSFGANSLLQSQDNRSAQLANQSSWYSADNHHTLKLTSSITYDALTTDVAPSLLGSFAFNSLADLEARVPSSFSRTLSRNIQSGGQLVGASSFGDYWRPGTNMQVQYGVRVDANRFLTAPSFNKGLLDAFGARNDFVPNRVYASPRLGVQWTYGSSPRVAYAPGAARPPRAVIHAGAGIFQNISDAQLVSSAVASTGLTGSTQSILCVGSAVPFPDWGSFLSNPETIPSRCRDGSTGTVFSSAMPNVTLFDPHFEQPKSLRAAADWSGPILDNRFVLGVQGIVSSGLNQPGSVDINLDATTRFVLANEGGRPIYADPGAIVSTTGNVATNASRLSPAFQRVLKRTSDLRTDSKQLSVNLSPVTANAYFRWDLTYTLLDVREQFNGFASTAGNPFAIETGRGLQGGRHDVRLRWGDIPVFDFLYITTLVDARSGVRYTPSVAGDINGDGALNDRAFIFDPRTAQDAAVAGAMQSLLSNGEAGNCLASQLDRLAARGSCQAPWTIQATTQVKFNPVKLGLPKRVNIVLALDNPLGLADLTLHGSDGLHGWGQVIPPDQNLLFVRGFDQAARQFRYEVNQRFGSTRPQQSAVHAIPYVALAINLDIGVPRERQLLTQRLDIGRAREGAKVPAESMKILGGSSIPNPMDMILQQADSLELTRKQADSLATLSHLYAMFADSVWTPVSRYLAALPDNYSHADAYAHYVTAREQTVDYLLHTVAGVKEILTPAQRRRLPPQVSNYLDERVLRFLRSSTVGDNVGILR